MKPNQRVAFLLGHAILFAVVGCVAPVEDPLAQLLDSVSPGLGVIGGQKVSGPISIRDSIVGDIISISVNVNSTIRTNVSVQLLQTVVCALNEYGDLVNVNVNVTANIQNEINQDYMNVLALLLSSTGDVDLFRKLSKANEETSPTTVSSASVGKDVPSQQHETVNIEEALKKLFPKLASKQ
uniref:Uncharacterized protein n=1 Tax=Anopheles stephensi TaxID=30069 RepID=A0A182XVH5_ANOST